MPVPELDEPAIFKLASEVFRERRRDERAGIGREEKLRIGRDGERRMRALHHRIDVGRLSRDRYLVRKAPGGQARPRRREGRAIDRHLVVGQLAPHAPRQHPLDERVVFEDQFLPFAGGTELAENLARLRVPHELLPTRNRPDELHERQAANKIRAALGQVKGKRRSPILHHEIGRADPRFRDECVEIAHMILDAIGDVRLARLAEADQVRGDAMGDVGDKRNDVAPDEGRGRIAM